MSQDKISPPRSPNISLHSTLTPSTPPSTPAPDSPLSTTSTLSNGQNTPVTGTSHFSPVEQTAKQTARPSPRASLTEPRRRTSVAPSTSPPQIGNRPSSSSFNAFQSFKRRWRAFWTWRGWLWILCHLPYLTAVAVPSGMVFLGATGPEVGGGLWFCEIGDDKLGGLGYCSGGVCKIEPFYSLKTVAEGSWKGTKALSTLLITMALGGILAFGSLIFVGMRYCCHSSTLSVPDIERDPKMESDGKRNPAEIASQHFAKVLNMMCCWVFVVSLGLAGWIGEMNSDADWGQFVWIGVIALCVIWLFTKSMFRVGYDQLQKRMEGHYAHGEEEVSKSGEYKTSDGEGDRQVDAFLLFLKAHR